MRRVIGIDIHRTFGEVVFWEDGELRHAGRIDMTRTALEGFGKSLLATDEIVIEATGKAGRSHARAMLVEAAWAAAKTPGPLHAFFVRIRARRGHQIAAVAVARKLTVLCWHMLSKERDYLWARPALVANKLRAMKLKAGKPQKKGNQRGPAYAYNVKALREQEMQLADQAEQSYEHFVEQWLTRPPKNWETRRPQSSKV